jgi:hypothetical protein
MVLRLASRARGLVALSRNLGADAGAWYFKEQPMPTLIEVAVYAAVLAHGAPLSCTARDAVQIECSNGVSARLAEDGVIRFSSGVAADRDGDGFPRFSDGTHSWWASAGWIAFSNGIQIRKMGADRFRLSTGVECRALRPETVECVAVKPD